MQLKKTECMQEREGGKASNDNLPPAVYFMVLTTANDAHILRTNLAKGKSGKLFGLYPSVRPPVVFLSFYPSGLLFRIVTGPAITIPFGKMIKWIRAARIG